MGSGWVVRAGAVLVSLLAAAAATPAAATPGEVSGQAGVEVGRALPAGGVLKVRAGSPGTTVMGNLTVVAPQAAGYTSAYPCTEGLPVDAKGNPSTSVNNYGAGQTVPNFAAVKTDSNGDICIYTRAAAHLLWDQTVESGAVASHTARRLLDTRLPSGGGVRVAAGQVKKVRAGAPGTTVMGNLTVVAPQAAGYTSVFPCTEGLPVDAKGNPSTSVNNYGAGQTVPNFAAVKTDSNGDICIYTRAAAHLLWDQTVESGDVGAQVAVRIFDSRWENNPRRPAGAVVKIRAWLPNSTVMGNLTVTDAQAAGYTSVFPCTEGMPKDAKGNPSTSVNNYTAGKTVSNFTAVRTDRNGDICVYTRAEAHLVWDQTVETFGVQAATARRLADTREGVPAAGDAAAALGALPVKGRAPKTGYDREGQFGPSWADVDRNGCDTRNDILARDLTNLTYKNNDGCTIATGTLDDPYTGATIQFVRGTSTSWKVQIDHVVALSDAWQKGAQQIGADARLQLANDPLNLLAVDGPANSQKGDGDAATWLPANKPFRCDYVARQVAVKQKYGLWVTQAEHDAISTILAGCPGQRLPQ